MEVESWEDAKVSLLVFESLRNGVLLFNMAGDNTDGDSLGIDVFSFNELEPDSGWVADGEDIIWLKCFTEGFLLTIVEGREYSLNWVFSSWIDCNGRDNEYLPSMETLWGGLPDCFWRYDEDGCCTSIDDFGLV